MYTAWELEWAALLQEVLTLKAFPSFASNETDAKNSFMADPILDNKRECSMPSILNRRAYGANWRISYSNESELESSGCFFVGAQNIIIIIIIIIIIKGWQCKAGRAINTLSVRRPQPHNTNPQNERREKESSRRQNVSDQLGQ